MRRRNIPSVTPCENVTPFEDVTPKVLHPVTPSDVTPLDKTDWLDRRNYTKAYLDCLDEQGGVLTEASAPLIRWRWPEVKVPRPVDPIKKRKALEAIAGCH